MGHMSVNRREMRRCCHSMRRKIEVVGSDGKPHYGAGGGDAEAHGDGGHGDGHGHGHGHGDGPKASIPFSIFNLTNTMIGGGTVAMPFAFKSAGLGLSLIFMVVILVFSDYTQWLLVRCGTLAGKLGHTYEDVGRRAYGEIGVKIVQTVEIFNTFGVLCAYLVIIADQSKVLDEWLSPDFILLRWHSKLFLVTAVVVAITPLSLLKNISFLSVPSMLSLLAIGMTGLAVMIRGFTHAEKADPAAGLPACDIDWFHLDNNMLYALPVVTLGFTSHINLYAVYGSLKNATPGRMSVVSHVSMICAMVFYVGVGTLGYMTFCSETPSDILTGYSSSDNLIQVCRVLMIASFIFSYPLLCFPCRHAVEQVFFKGKPFSWPRWIAITLTIIATTFVVAISVPNVAPLFALVGSITATMLVFVMPPLFYLKLHPDPLFSTPSKIFAAVVLIVGSLFGTGATAAVIYNITQGNAGG